MAWASPRSTRRLPAVVPLEVRMSHSVTHPPSPAVEVVATLGDSVVGVAHVSNPKGGATTRATRAMIIGGAVGILAGALAFLAATRIAAGNHAALAAWV